MINIYLVEDDEATREDLCTQINAHPHLKVTAAVGTCKAIREALALKTPDVLLVDLDLPDGNGLDIISEAATRDPALDIMVITVFGEERQVIGAIKAGASGYLLKDDDSQHIGAAILRLVEGGSPISASIARYFIERLRSGARPKTVAAGDLQLSQREIDILTFAAKGYSNAEIAGLLGLTVNTIGTYTKRIYRKLAVRSRSEALFEASNRGLMDGPYR